MRPNYLNKMLNNAVFDWIDLVFIILGGFLGISIYHLFVFLTGSRINSSTFGGSFPDLLAPIVFAGPIIRRVRANRRGRPLPSAPAGPSENWCLS